MWDSTRRVLDGVNDLQATSADTPWWKAYLLVLLPIVLLAVSGAIKDTLATRTTFTLLSAHLALGGGGIYGSAFFLDSHGDMWSGAMLGVDGQQRSLRQHGFVDGG